MGFQKGQSGNPGGRPKGYKKMIEAFREMTVAASGKLEALMNDPEVPPQTQAYCANAILDRGWGKAPASVDITHHASARPARELSTAELMRIAAGGVTGPDKADTTDTEH